MNYQIDYAANTRIYHGLIRIFAPNLVINFEHVDRKKICLFREFY